MNNERPPVPSPRENLRGLRIFFWSLHAGVLLLFILTVIVSKLGAPRDLLKDIGNGTFILSTFLVALVSIIIARQQYARGINKIRILTGTVNDKLNFYRSLFIRVLALCEGMALFGVIVYFASGDSRAVWLTVIMTGAMLSFAPTSDRLIRDLEIGWEEQEELGLIRKP